MPYAARLRSGPLLTFYWLMMSAVLLSQWAQPLGSILLADEPGEFYRNEVKPILVTHCFECHANDPDDLNGGLSLGSTAAIKRGGDSGPAIDADQPLASILVKAINYDVYEMPPDGKLSQAEIDILTKWVAWGVPIPADEEVEHDPSAHSQVPQVNAKTKQWWSFQPVGEPEIPDVGNLEWPHNEIDSFILAKLESAGLTPVLAASRQQLIRRAYYDLIGLPPTPAEVDSFVNDSDPDSFRRLIDELLESPHYGEKWGRHWLDLVRYAETNSFERDGAKPFVWRYRDYVIRAFNADKPYDQFLIEQLAGDELQEPTPESIIATGYYRLGAWDDEPADPIQAKYDDLDDIVATTGQTLLGLTVNCARCHDHKIDPIPQADYYRLVSFFENIQRYGVRDEQSVENASVVIIPGPAPESETRTHEKSVTDATQRLKKIEAIVMPDLEPVEREDFEYESNRIEIVKKRLDHLLTQKQVEQYKRLTEELQRLNENPPGSIRVLCVKEEGAKAPSSFIRVRGNANVTGDEIQPGFVSVLSPPEPIIAPPSNKKSTGRRLALAKWIASPDNPLTARVMVNRIWQYHFGRGIVHTTSDFGFQGSPPTHPELLDWLSAEFVARGWSIKAMHRLIMNSAAYQMSSRFNENSDRLDPANDHFWRFDMRRLTAEEIRDSLLAVNHQLNESSMFGPSIFPIQPAEVLAGQSVPGKGWGKSTDTERRRRSIYIHVKRSLPVPILSTNDSADTDNTCPVRFITTQPTQALGMMNSQFTNKQAKLLAKSVMTEHEDLSNQISEVLKRVTQRNPTAEEIKRGLTFVEGLRKGEAMSTLDSLETFCLLALNLNEFVYIN